MFYTPRPMTGVSGFQITGAERLPILQAEKRQRRSSAKGGSIMCLRTVFWEETMNDPGKKPAQSPAGEKPHDLQTTPNRRSLPPVLEGCLDFIKGVAGVKSSSAQKA